jgi:hypothetical protein
MLNAGRRSVPVAPVEFEAPGVPAAPDGEPSPERGDGSVTVADGRPVAPLEPLSGADALAALAGAEEPDGAALAGAGATLAGAAVDAGAAAGAAVGAAAGEALGDGWASTGVAAGAATGCADAAAAGAAGAGTGSGVGAATG